MGEVETAGAAVATFTGSVVDLSFDDVPETNPNLDDILPRPPALTLQGLFRKTWAAGDVIVFV